MNNTEKIMKTVNTLLTISTLSFAAAALIFIAILVFGEEEGTRNLTLGLGCVALGTLLNIVRMTLNRKYSGSIIGGQEDKEDK